MNKSRAPKKRFGQNFLTSSRYAERIACAVDASSDENILEIGAGKGSLSCFLKKRFPKFHCIEMDVDIVPRLKEKLGGGEWTLHIGDALEFDFLKAGVPLHVVGNLPYNVGALILKKSLMYGDAVRSCTFMMQREVAERITAGPGSKKNGFITVFCRFFGRPKILFHVPPGAFFPKPGVWSSVFRIEVAPKPEERLRRESWENFFGFIDRGFSMRRKKLVNALGAHGDRGKYRDILAGMGIPDGVRAEELDIYNWLELYKRSCE